MRKLPALLAIAVAAALLLVPGAGAAPTTRVSGLRRRRGIAWGSGRLGSVRAIFESWIGSSGHRANILGSYEQIGIGLRSGTVDGYSGARVWTQHFGSPC